MASKEKREEIFSSYPIPKAVAALAIPSVLSSIVNVIYNMADTYFVSLMKDTNATAAVSLTMPVFLFFVATFFFLLFFLFFCFPLLLYHKFQILKPLCANLF